MVELYRSDSHPKHIYVIFHNDITLTDIEIVIPYLDTYLVNKSNIIYTVEFAPKSVIRDARFALESAKFIARYGESFDSVTVHSLSLVNHTLYKIYCAFTDRFIKRKYNVDQILLSDRSEWENSHKISLEKAFKLELTNR